MREVVYARQQFRSSHRWRTGGVACR
jgi:hypothetical protein